jgi:hypothetical protein
MSTEILLLAILGSLTVLAYMVAINSRGPTRLSISYLLATILLAGTVTSIVQYVNSDIDKREMEKVKQLEFEKQQAEQRIQAQDQALRQNKEHSVFATKLTTYLTTGTGFATTMVNVDLRDMSVELDQLIARSNDMKKKVADFKADCEKVSPTDSGFTQIMQIIKDGITGLAEAAQYYSLYYRSEDSAQEELRERIMRQKARVSLEKFQQASALVASM